MNNIDIKQTALSAKEAVAGVIEENEGLLSDIKDAAVGYAKEVDSVIGKENGRSGKLNNRNVNLVFPSDVGKHDSGNGIMNWIQFTTYFKENGSLSGFIQNLFEFGEGETSKTNPEIAATLSETSQFSTAGNAQGIYDFIANLAEGASPAIADSRLSRATSKDGDQISIYLPGGIQFSDQLNYEETSFAGLKSLTNINTFKAVSQINTLRKLAGMVDNVASFVGQETLNLGQAISAELGVIVNPRAEQMFQGVAFRSFTLNFNLIPRSKEEAKTAGEIIKTFRFHAYPELSSTGAFYNVPSEFGIKFLSYHPVSGLVTENKSIPKLKRCFLEKIDTNYTPDEVYNSFRDGSPIRVEISLGFRESQCITRNDVEGGY